MSTVVLTAAVLFGVWVFGVVAARIIVTATLAVVLWGWTTDVIAPVELRALLLAAGVLWFAGHVLHRAKAGAWGSICAREIAGLLTAPWWFVRGWMGADRR